MSNHNSLSVGVLGTGWVALDRHIPSFRRNPFSRVTVVYDRTPGKATAAARRHGLPHAATTLDEFFSHSPDIVSIATPPWTHRELALQAFAAGAHVFTEKPMAMSTAEAEEMAAAAKAADRKLCVSHNLLFSRSAGRARHLLGDTPDLVYAAGVQLSSHSRRLPSWYRQLPGGLLFDECPHLLYTLGSFLGPLTIDHVRGHVDDVGHPHQVEVLVSGSAPGQITMTFGAPVSEWQVVLVSRRRVVALDLFRDIAIDLPSDGAHGPAQVLGTSLRATGGHVRGVLTSGSRYLTRRLLYGHDRLISEFVDSIRLNRPSPIAVEDAISVVRLAEEIVAALGASHSTP
ncbi:MAG: Gfo/Idh/MocA family protein [Acidimicrobiia bacterium]